LALHQFNAAKKANGMQHCHSLTVIGVIGNMAMTNDCQICKLTRKFCAETGPGLMNSSHLNSDTLIAYLQFKSGCLDGAV
jgi:hypothetical protein